MRGRCGGADKGEGVAEPSLKGWGDVPLRGVGGLEGDNMRVYLDGERKDGLLPFVDLGELEDVAVESIEGDVELRRARSEQRYQDRGVIEKAL